jgi:hypothetical protein
MDLTASPMAKSMERPAALGNAVCLPSFAVPSHTLESRANRGCIPSPPDQEPRSALSALGVGKCVASRCGRSEIR